MLLEKLYVQVNPKEVMMIVVERRGAGSNEEERIWHIACSPLGWRQIVIQSLKRITPCISSGCIGGQSSDFVCD